MFGHDVHRPELDDSSGPTDPLLSSTSEPTDGPPRNAETMRHLAWRGPAPGGDAAVAPFADFLRREAARPRPPVGFPLSQAEETDSIAVSRRRITSNVLLVVFGATAIVTAVILGLRSGTPEPAPGEAVIGTPGATPPETTAGNVVPPPSSGPDNVTKSATSPPPCTGRTATTSTGSSAGDGCAARADCATGSCGTAGTRGAARGPAPSRIRRQGADREGYRRRQAQRNG